MSSLNKVMLIGRLGRDPETRYTKSGAAVANFSVATDSSYKGSDGTKVEKTEWHNVVAWAAQADFVQNYLKKGALVYIEGRIETRDWMNNQNVRQYRTEIIANSVQSLGGKRDDQQQDTHRQADGQAKYAAAGDNTFDDDTVPF